MVITFTYQFIMELREITVHEGNSAIFSVFWFSIVTIPTGIIILLVLWLGSLLYNFTQKRKHRDDSSLLMLLIKILNTKI